MTTIEITISAVYEKKVQCVLGHPLSRKVFERMFDRLFEQDMDKLREHVQYTKRLRSDPNVAGRTLYQIIKDISPDVAYVVRDGKIDWRATKRLKRAKHTEGDFGLSELTIEDQPSEVNGYDIGDCNAQRCVIVRPKALYKGRCALYARPLFGFFERTRPQHFRGLEFNLATLHMASFLRRFCLVEYVQKIHQKKKNKKRRATTRKRAAAHAVAPHMRHRDSKKIRATRVRDKGEK